MPGAKALAGSFAMSRFAGDSTPGKTPGKRPFAKAFCILPGLLPLTKCNISWSAYRVGLPPHLSNLHDVFHVSQLRKYVADPSHVVPRDDVEVRDNLTIETMPIRIEAREVKKLRGKEIPLVKVVWEWSNW